MPAFTCQLLPLILWTAIVSPVMPYASAQDESEPVRQSTRSRRVLYNFDGDSCLSTNAGSKGPVPVNIDDVKRLIEEVAYEGSRVDTVLVCINAQVMYYPTKIGTMRGTLSTPEERSKWPASEKQRFENMKAFFDAGVDPYAVMLAETKRRGCEALLTFRMNDDHGNDFLHTKFLVDHADWRLGTKQYQGSGAMDFARDEVRDYTFRLIEEAVGRYDCDGIELDFNRFPRFFKDGATDERVAKMNSLVERVRKMLDEAGRQRGRRLVLSVRPPSNFGRTPPTPETARELGCDVPAWVKHGWIDFVAVSEFLYERGDLPIDQWKQAITTVPVYGGIECTKGGGAKNLTANEYRGAATQLIKAGADGVYLFNFFTSREGGEAAYEPPFEVLRDLAVTKDSDQTAASPPNGWQPHEVRQLAGNGDLLAACRTDVPRRLEGKTLDHYERLGISISKDGGRTWSDVKKLYDYGRHHPSLVLMPNHDIVMTYVVRLGYIDDQNGFPQFGIEAVVSHDHGATWDLDHRYLLHVWSGKRKGETYWWPSSQATSSTLMPDGAILTAFGTGYCIKAGKDSPQAPRDAGLIEWRLNTKPVNAESTIRDAAFDSDLRNRLDPQTGSPFVPEKARP